MMASAAAAAIKANDDASSSFNDPPDKELAPSLLPPHTPTSVASMTSSSQVHDEDKVSADGFPSDSSSRGEQASKPPSTASGVSSDIGGGHLAAAKVVDAVLDESDTITELAKSPSGTLEFPQLPSLHHSQPANIPRGRSHSGATHRGSSEGGVKRMSAADLHELASSPESLPVMLGPSPPPDWTCVGQEFAPQFHVQGSDVMRHAIARQADIIDTAEAGHVRDASGITVVHDQFGRNLPFGQRTLSTPPTSRNQQAAERASLLSTGGPRRYSYNVVSRPRSMAFDGAPYDGLQSLPPPPPLETRLGTGGLVNQHLHHQHHKDGPTPPPPAPRMPSPMPPMIPMPPLSLPTHLQLELAAQRPSPLYIHQSAVNDLPYESSLVKFERLKNVLLLPPYLERTLYFGALACLDAWLYTFTILPIRFISALAILAKWWAYALIKEARWVVAYVWFGLGRVWRRGPTELIRGFNDVAPELWRPRGSSATSDSSSTTEATARSTGRSGSDHLQPRGRVSMSNRAMPNRGSSNGGAERVTKSPSLPSFASSSGLKSTFGPFHHRRTKSQPSTLTAYHKADLLQGAVIICSSIALMTLDASRMYHFIRAQSAIKLYVIYNILEVGDRLLSALGQDILECLFSNETLSRNASGRSKILQPLGMFVLALIYNCIHSIMLYYQVISLNVAVNSYSNALLTLLLSNQFVEIKGTVFKRFDKDNLFQLTCADIVERFQLWIMLLIIGMRNVVEVGGLTVPGAGFESGSDDILASVTTSSSNKHVTSSLPHSFTFLSSWFASGEVLSPFLIVIGSEMLVDVIKHAYVTKFNNIKRTFYTRILDILCKDYYTNAFVAPSLTRRLGLAVIPLSCLFIRASIQTYHMFLSTHLSMPVPPPSTQTSLTEESAVPSSPAIIDALNRLDNLIRGSLGRATYGYPYGSPLNSRPWYSWTSDDAIAALTMVIVFFLVFLVLLITKLLLGMVLLSYARNRYAGMKRKEQSVAKGQTEREGYDAQGRRIGGYGHIEIGDDRHRWVNADPMEGLKPRRREDGFQKAEDPGQKQHRQPHAADDGEYNGVFRFEMVAKRIW